MREQSCSERLSDDLLVEYWQGELTETEAERVEAHYLSCEACASRLDALAGVATGVVKLMRGGRVLGFTTVAVLERAASEGLKIGTYRMEPGQSAHCTIRPEDDCNVLRLPLALRGIERVDLDLVRVEADQETSRLHFDDVVLDREREEIVLLYPGDLLRQLPEHTFEIAVHAADAQERRVLGRYTMFHSPWRG
jgi:hypothetical protein